MLLGLSPYRPAAGGRRRLGPFLESSSCFFLQVTLEKGFSQLDWVQLTKKDADLAGGQRQEVSLVRAGVLLPELGAACLPA